jgi:chromodomain-helicase-DNA-binding protein 7
MYFVNELVGSCDNAPFGLALPDIPMPALLSWSLRMDRLLLHATFMAGYREYRASQFSPFARLPVRILTGRIIELVDEMKRRFAEFCREGHHSFPFNTKTYSQAREWWTASDQAAVLALLVHQGWFAAEAFGRELEPPRRARDVLRLAGSIFRCCEGSVDAASALPAPITPEMRGLVEKRVRFFQLLRKLSQSDKLCMDDRTVLSHVDEIGFLRLAEDEVIVARFGAGDLEDKVTEFVLSLAAKAELAMPLMPNLIIREPPRTPDEEPDPLQKPQRVHSSGNPIQFDDSGAPIMPIVMRPGLIITCLGTVVTDRPGWRNERYIYPAGFTSERLGPSVTEGGVRVWYRSMIVDTGGPLPLFRIEMKDDPDVYFCAKSPSNVWITLLKEAEARKIEKDLSSGRKIVSVSGPEYYGLSDPRVTKLIRMLPGADVTP